MVNNKPVYTQTPWLRFEHTNDMRPQIESERELISMAIALGARKIAGWSREEESLAESTERIARDSIHRLKCDILQGRDPLGDAFSIIRSPLTRRAYGATYTPIPVVEAMLNWAKANGPKPGRLIEPGTGSARFLFRGAKFFPAAQLLGIEADPVSAIVARANLAAVGAAGRAEIILGDYRTTNVPVIEYPTLYIGNPPYVRHHGLDAEGKKWLSNSARMLGFKASQLAGLHVHFFLATALKARPDDFGIFITSGEWLDVNYGKLVRQLFLNQLGGEGITIIEPTSRTFSDAATTAAVAQFRIGTVPHTIRLNRAQAVESRNELEQGPWLNRREFDPQRSWSILSRGHRIRREGYIELGEFCTVHRGQVTGANRVWIAGHHSQNLPPSVLFPSITKAVELFKAGNTLTDTSELRDVIDIPYDFSGFSRSDQLRIRSFLEQARRLGADRGYIAETRKAWWSVGLRSPAPILATYMARRKPAFVRNLAQARHINIAHGIYPRVSLSSEVLDRICRSLSASVSIDEGRTYAGGLTKFEPKEMERILIPNPMVTEAVRVA